MTPPPVDALIARLREIPITDTYWNTKYRDASIPVPVGTTAHEAAAALAAQAQRIAELEQCQVGAFSTLGEDALRGVIAHNKAAYIAMQDRAERSEARVAELQDDQLAKAATIVRLEAALRQEVGALADIAFSDDMTLDVARRKAKRMYDAAQGAKEDGAGSSPADRLPQR